MPRSKLYIVPSKPGERQEVPNNLPAQPAHLVGREAEVEIARRILGDTEPEVSMLTLVGPGGVGKTRLALAVAEEMLEEFEDGVYVIELASITNPELVVPVIATTLQVREARGTQFIATLKEHLRDKRMLLVLDNFEQILPAAKVVAELLAACPALKLIVTSRSALHLRAEHEFPLKPLALPEPGQSPSLSKLSHYGAVALFVQRARVVKPDFALTEGNAPSVTEVCRRVDGLPLAIELVAAHTRLLPPQAILARLAHPLRLLTGGAQDLPNRQQTLRDTIEWSYRLLSEGEQRVFRRLSVFVGGLALRGAEVVCNDAGDVSVQVDDPLAIEVMERVEALVDRSLVRRLEQGEEDDPRLMMLETVREYAREQLEASGEAETMRRRHADYYLALAERIQPEMSRSNVQAWMGQLGPEHDNLRAALRWLLESDKPADCESALRLILDLADLWGRYHNASEVREWLETAFSKANLRTKPLRVRALRYASTLSYLSADYTQAETWAEEALTGARELNDDKVVASSLNHLGLLAVFQGKYEQARALLEESLDLFRKLGDETGMAAACINLGETVRYQGDYERAEAYYRESLRIFNGLGRKVGALQALSNIGHMIYMRGDLPSARATLLEALALAQATDARKLAAEVLAGLSSVILAESGVRDQEPETGPPPSRSPDPRSPAPDHKGVTQAVRVLGLASAIVEQSGRQLEPIDQAEFDRNVASAQMILGEAAFGLAWEDGRAMTLAQTLDLVTRSDDAASQSRAQGYAREQLPGGLTEREMEVTALVARGLTNEAIAQRLVLSKRTVEMHVSNALRKLGIARRTELAAWAIDQGIRGQGPGVRSKT